MSPFPLPLTELFTPFGQILIYFIIGLGFGIALEISGFGSSPKLAAQFYFKEMTVLKVMFTAIVTAMVLIFLASAVGLLDYNLIWVNPTYLWPGIVGGLIMGVGFIIGGFCPGTSLVGLATFKLDGLFFTLGSLFGIFAFGETVGLFDEFYNSSYMGRFTLPEFFGLPTGVVVLLVVFMALFMFWGSEQLERIFGGKDPKKAPKLRYAGAGVLTMAAVAVMVIGQPTTADRWNVISAEKEQLLQDRAVQIHPGELLATMHEHKVNLVMLDVRSEADYNLFHIRDARRVDIETLPELAPELLLEPSNTVFVLMSNGETAATEAWKVLAAESVPNIYILEGGINAWLAVFAEEDQGIQSVSVSGDDRYQFIFNAALGSSYHAARPHPEDYQLEYIPKIQLQNRKGPSGGGCG